MGREDPIEFNICSGYILFCLFFDLNWYKCFVGVMGGMILTPLCFELYIYVYLFWSIYFDYKIKLP